VARTTVGLTELGVTDSEPRVTVALGAKLDPLIVTLKVNAGAGFMITAVICGTGFKSCTDMDEIKLGSATDAAVTVTCPAAGLDGGVYIPANETEPSVAALVFVPKPDTDHAVSVLLSPSICTAYCADDPTLTLEGPLIAIVGDGRRGCTEPPTLEQPAEASETTVTMKLS
jgi:hypothetical protein